MAKLFERIKHIGEKDPFGGRTDLCFLKHFRLMRKLGSGSYSHVCVPGLDGRALAGRVNFIHEPFLTCTKPARIAHCRYQVRRKDDDREYALKATDMCKLSNVERISLVEEVRYLASMDHPNIVRYYEAFIEEQWLCLITELVLGGDVSRLIQ